MQTPGEQRQALAAGAGAGSGGAGSGAAGLMGEPVWGAQALLPFTLGKSLKSVTEW